MTANPKLLIITTNFPRQEGDPQSPWLLELLGRMQQRGFVIDVLAPAYAGSPDQVFRGMRVRRFRYAPAAWEKLTHDEGAPNKLRKNPLLLLLLPCYLLAGLWAAAQMGRRGRYDIIHVHWPIPQGVFGLAAQAAVVASRAAGGGKLVATYYGADLVMASRFRVVLPFLRYFTRRCHEVAAISSYTAATLTRATGRAPQIIPYGIEVPPLDRLTRAADVRSAEPGVILTVGRLVARKGHRVLIDALALLAAQSEAENIQPAGSNPAGNDCRCRLVIVGEGHERDAITAQVAGLGLADRVTLTGRINDAELQQHYQNCQVFVLPAIVDPSGDTEMLGMVLLEAMRYRKPVIASHVGGIPDIIQHSETGLLVPPGDPAALATAIRQVQTDARLAQRLGDAGYAYARSHFSWEAVEAATLAMYGLHP